MRRAAAPGTAAAVVAGALAAALVPALVPAAPAAAEPLPNGPTPWTASTTGANGAFVVSATCSFGPIVWPGRPESFEYAGAAAAPGAVATTVTCYARTTEGRTATVAGPAAAVAGRELWESIDAFCVSASALLPTGAVVTAPKTCVTP